MTPSPEQELIHLKEENLLRTVRVWQTGDLPHLLTSEGKPLLNFSSNDYLGLSQHPALKNAAQEAIQKHGTGSTASRLVCGTFDFHRQLEQRIARLKQSQDARTFANGYSTAMATIPSLLGKEDVIILDKLSHACLIDAAKFSGATIRAFPHNNIERLQSILQTTRKKSAHSKILIVTESVFSMDGDICPLPEIIALKEQYGALLLLDEAHALGVIGEHGLGLAEKLGLQEKVDLQMGTLGKAAGSAGGYLAADQNTIDLITNKGRAFIYSTAPPPAQIAASHAALDLITSTEGSRLRQRLQDNIHTLSPSSTSSSSPIIPLILGTNEKALQASEQLLSKGFLVPAIRFPTVPRNSARLRITISAAHSKEQIKFFKKNLAQLQQEH